MTASSRPSSPVGQKKTILRHQNSVKNEKVKKVSLEVVNEKPYKSLGQLSTRSLSVHYSLYSSITAIVLRQSSTLNKPIFHMGASFEDRSDEEALSETNGTLNNNCKGVKDENYPLMPRKN